MAKSSGRKKPEEKANRATNLDLFCWYIHPRRVAQLVGPLVPANLRGMDSLAGLTGPMAGNHYEAILKTALLKWLAMHPVDPIERQLLHKSLSVGSYFSCYRDYYFVNKRSTKRKVPERLASAYSKLTIGSKKYELQITYDRKDLWTTSALSKCSGHTTVMVIGYVEKIREGTIHSRPLVIADVTKKPESSQDCRWPSERYGELWPESTDTFSKVLLQPMPRSLTALSKIPERDIKAAFAEILGEPNVAKDWGGEENDLFTTRLRVHGIHTPAAFLFKGPAKFKPMTFAELGKNGDQIERLYKSPADILVLQHCNAITSPVRTIMRALSTQINNPRACLILDGFQTLRILKAYRKCGLKPAKPMKPPGPVTDPMIQAMLSKDPFSDE